MKNEHTTIPKTATRLGRETALKGRLRFTDSVSIRGRFEGEIDADGFLFVEDGADVRANIRVHSIVIGGIVHGNIVAEGRVEMLPGGRVFGNVKAAKIRIADGVVFEGKCEMVKNASNVDIFSQSLEELKTAAGR